MNRVYAFFAYTTGFEGLEVRQTLANPAFVNLFVDSAEDSQYHIHTPSTPWYSVLSAGSRAIQSLKPNKATVFVLAVRKGR